jgi:hypothetical protein
MSGGASSMRIWSRPTSSSSAISSDSEVWVPWPVSAFWLTNVTLPLGSMRKWAFRRALPSVAASARRASATVTSSAPPARSDLPRKRRRSAD